MPAGGAVLLRFDPQAAGGPLRVAFEAGRLAFQGYSEPGPLELAATGDPPAPWIVRWDGAAGVQRHRGRLLLGARDGAIVLACALTLEEYLPGVLGAEMSPATAPLEALKAQAVAARTFALFGIQSQEARRLEPLFAADSSFQAYGGIDKEHPRAVEAVRATLGEVLVYKGRLFRAYFHSTCGGGTASARDVFNDAAIPPLGGSPCADCADSRHARWTSVWSEPELFAALRPWCERNSLHPGAILDLTVTEQDSSGRARYVRVRHAGGAFDMLAVRLRSLLGSRSESPVKSTAFSVSMREGQFVFEGRGWGHGVGLCQTGAARRGEREGYRAILEHYFPESGIEGVYGPGKIAE